MIAIETDSMHFIDEGDGVVLECQVTDRLDGGYGAVHTVDTFEDYTLVLVEWQLLQFEFQVLQIVVFEDDFVGLGVPDAFDETGVVFLVGKVDQVRQHFG